LLTNLDQILKASSQDVIPKENSFFQTLFREIEDKKEKKEIRIKQEILKESQDLSDKNNTNIQDITLEKKRNFNDNLPVPLHISKFPVFYLDEFVKNKIALGKKLCYIKVEKLEI